MSNKQNPEIPQKLIDAIIRTVIEQGFSPGIDAVAERAGVSKTIALAQYPTRTGLTVAALERVGRETIKNLEAAITGPTSRDPPSTATSTESWTASPGSSPTAATPPVSSPCAWRATPTRDRRPARRP